MKKKIIVVNILAVFILVTISYATAVDTNTMKVVDKKESPLYKLRTLKTIGEKIEDIIENIRTKFLGERMFFMPFKFLRNNKYGDSMESVDIPTCPRNPCTFECTQKITSCPVKTCQ